MLPAMKPNAVSRVISTAASPSSRLLNHAFVHQWIPAWSGYTVTSLGMSKLCNSISSPSSASTTPLFCSASLRAFFFHFRFVPTRRCSFLVQDIVRSPLSAGSVPFRLWLLTSCQYPADYRPKVLFQRNIPSWLLR